MLFTLLFLALALPRGMSGQRQEVKERKCVHSTHVEPEIERLVRTIDSIPLETHRSANNYFHPYVTRSLLENVEAQPIRIHVEYQLGGLPSDKVDFMKETLIPAMKGVFQRTLFVKKPVQGTFFLPYSCISTFPGYPGYCHDVGYDCLTAIHNKNFFGKGRTCVQPYDDQCTDLPMGDGVDDADFILYVTAQDQAGCLSSSETVASAGFCLYDYDNWYGLPNRPLAGATNFCPDNIYLEKEKFGYMLDTAVHEVLHALLMTKDLYPKYINGAMETRTDSVVEKSGSLMVDTPAVKKAVQQIMGCSTMGGAKLENEGGYGTADSHWERRLFLGELMIGVSSSSSRVTLSNLTLALAEDSGWYEPQYARGGVLAAVQHHGCEFVEKDCRYYSKDLEDVFCWDTEEVSLQPSICTPDHMAIGYCKNDMSLISGCATIQAFSNTHCTNPDDQPSIGQVDLGIRNKPLARCFPVQSYKLSRTEDWYTVYRTDLGATCFETICKGMELYIHMPETKFHDAKDIRCPTGNVIELTEYDLGFDEGIIGPCPNNKLICENWGCPDDCNSNGICFEGVCHCNIGWVGNACSEKPCPEYPCPGIDDECQKETGLCYPAGTSTRIPSIPEPEKKPVEKSKPTGISEPFQQSPIFWDPKETTHTTQTTYPTGEETKPPRETKLPTSVPSPDLHEAPPKEPKEAYFVPAEGGRVVAVGYLHKCLVFEDAYNDQLIYMSTNRYYTGENGEWKPEEFPDDAPLVIDPTNGNECYDLFTGLRPLWRMRGFDTVKTLSAFSTLACLTPGADSNKNAKRKTTSQDNSESNESSTETFEVETDILQALGLQDTHLLQRDFIMETYYAADPDIWKAVVYNAIIANTVLQVSCYADGSKTPSFATSDLVFRILGSFMEDGVELDAFSIQDNVFYLVDKMVFGSTFDDQSKYAVSRVIADSNELAMEAISENVSGIKLLEAISRLTYVVQTNLCLFESDLHKRRISLKSFASKTTKQEINNLKNEANIPDIESIMSKAANVDIGTTNNIEDVTTTSSNEEDLSLGIPLLDTKAKEVGFVAALMGFFVIFTCSIFAYYRRWSAQ